MHEVQVGLNDAEEEEEEVDEEVRAVGTGLGCHGGLSRGC